MKAYRKLELVAIAGKYKFRTKVTDGDLTIKFEVRKLYPVGIYLLKVNNRNTRTRREICSKFNNKDTRTTSLCIYFTPFSSVSIVDFEQVDGLQSGLP